MFLDMRKRERWFHFEKTQTETPMATILKARENVLGDIRKKQAGVLLNIFKRRNISFK